jgi:hypothetical protein
MRSCKKYYRYASWEITESALAMTRFKLPLTTTMNNKTAFHSL